MTTDRPAWSLDSLALGLPATPPDAFTPQWAFAGSTGRGVTVAIIDSGVEADHPLLAGAVDEEAGAALAAGPDGRVDLVEGPHRDVYGHGTAVAGIIHALAPEARLVSIRVLDESLRGRAAVFHAGLAWAIDRGFDVINLSLGAGRRDWALAFHELCDRGYFANSFIVTAAANQAQEAFPSLFASVASVAANAATDPLRFHVNPEPPTEFLARGLNVEVPWRGGTTAVTTGNSFAAPHISGFAALIRSKHPHLRPFQVKTALWAASANAREAAAQHGSPRSSATWSAEGGAGGPGPTRTGALTRQAERSGFTCTPVATEGAGRPGPVDDDLRLLLDGYELEPAVGRDPWGPLHPARRAGQRLMVRRLDPGLAANATVLARFVATVRIVASLRHPHLVPVIELREHPDFAAVVMPRYPADLRQLVARGPLDPATATVVVLSVLAGLGPAHDRGVYHGDLRPDKVLVDVLLPGTRRAVVADVGLSAALSSDVRTSAAPHDPASWSYLAPEQIDGDAVGAFTDVHGAGLLLFELLTGELPFPTVATLGALVRQRATTRPRSLADLVPDLPAALVAVADSAVSLDPVARPPTVRALAGRLTRAAAEAFGPRWLHHQTFRLEP